MCVLYCAGISTLIPVHAHFTLCTHSVVLKDTHTDEIWTFIGIILETGIHTTLPEFTDYWSTLIASSLGVHCQDTMPLNIPTVMTESKRRSAQEASISDEVELQ